MCRYISFGLCSVLLLGSAPVAGAAGTFPSTTLPFPTSPAETLHYDDGSPETYLEVTDANCERMPPASTPYPFRILAVLWNSFDTTPFELHIWDDDGAGGLPGTSLFSQVVTPPSSGWFEVQITPPVTIPDGRVYIGCMTLVGIGFDLTDPDYNEAYWDMGFGWEPLSDYGYFGDFLIRAVVDSAQPQNDVGVPGITSPDTLINPNQPVQPEALVKNFGALDQDSFQVWCLIDSIDMNVYTEVDTVFVLASGDSTTVLFPSWTPDGGGNAYQVMVYTALLGDEVPDNDTMMKTVRTILHDVGVDSIVAPPDTVFTGFTYEPIARVRNFGNVPETFDVTCTIDGYDDTVSVLNLYPDSAVPCTFNIWTVPWTDSTSYAMTVRTWVTDDENPSNDILSKPIFAYNPRDVGVDAILSPPDIVYPDSTYPVEALVCNHGEVTQDSLPVECIIDGYMDSTWLYDLEADSCTTGSLGPWTPAGPGPFMICCWTVLPYDRNPDNDTNCVTTYVGVDEQVELRIPILRTQLLQNQPNPFPHTTAIPYSVQGSRGAEERRRNVSTYQLVNLSVYDAGGRLVRTLVDGEKQPGFYTAVWDGTDDEGNEVGTGVYFYRLRAHDFTSCKKMVLLK